MDRRGGFTMVEADRHRGPARLPKVQRMGWLRPRSDRHTPPWWLGGAVGFVGWLAGYAVAQIAGWTEWFGESAWAGCAGFIVCQLALAAIWHITRRRRRPTAEPS
jgi:hypothetical protein